MIPIGYMYKTVDRCDRLRNVVDVYSLSNHGSKNFADFIPHWKHNGYWLFDRPGIMEQIAANEGIDLSRMTLFYYEAYGFEYDEATQEWIAFSPDPSFETNVVVPSTKHLEGFDVVSFSCGTSPEDSPLCCNGLANLLPVNSHCLFNSFAEAKEALEAGQFDNSEPGPFRIIAVYTVK